MAAAFSLPTLADQRLAESKQCFGCHAVATDGAGPAFKKVATYWRGRKDAESMLVRTIRQGSAGTGGAALEQGHDAGPGRAATRQRCRGQAARGLGPEAVT
jgi:cytochrome c551/c552